MLCCVAPGGPLSYALPASGIRSSLVQLEAEADSLTFVVNSSPGKILGEHMGALAGAGRHLQLYVLTAKACQVLKGHIRTTPDLYVALQYITYCSQQARTVNKPPGAQNATCYSCSYSCNV